MAVSLLENRVITGINKTYFWKMTYFPKKFSVK